VPQIFIDQKHIGSATEFTKYIRKHFGWFA